MVSCDDPDCDCNPRKYRREQPFNRERLLYLWDTMHSPHELKDEYEFDIWYW